MKRIIELFFKKNKNLKKSIILFLSGIGVLLLTLILWNLLFSKYYIFHEEEKEFLDAAKRYYEYHNEYLPKTGETREITLEKMFLENRIDSLYVPKTNKLCSTDSWVKVYKTDKGEYEYYTYLKCGKYHSKIDHEGPVITLNGDKNMIINLGSNYEDPGVKEVIDKKDGKIDIKKVQIDTSNVNTNKIGNYVVKYKVKDKLNNQTVVTRNVTVAMNLSMIVKENTDETNYYKGAVENNYVQFSGMLFRIINTNDDGSVNLILNNSISNLRYTEEEYEGSNIDKWLNDIFLPSITSSKYLVERDYCVGDVYSLTDMTGACDKKYKSKVGLLSVDEWYKTQINGISSTSYKYPVYYLLANKVGNQIVTATMFNSIDYGNDMDLMPIKPVITLKANSYVKSGDGTRNNPYKINDYNYGKEHDKINTRIIGEYFTYSGFKVRINGFDGDNVQVIMAEPFINNSNSNILTVSTNLEDYQFDVKKEGNPGYVLNNDFIDYISEKNIISKEYNIPINEYGLSYDKFDNKKMKAKLMLIASTDLFSGMNLSYANNTKMPQLLLDISANTDYIYYLDSYNGLVHEGKKDFIEGYALRAKFILNGNLKIKSGKGTFNNPYVLN